MVDAAKRKKPATDGTRKIIWVGIGCATFFWILESILHAFVFHKGTFITQILPANPHEIWMRSLVACMFITFGIYAHVIITRRKRVEQALRESEAKSQVILQTMPSGLFTVDLDRRITSWNEEAVKITGLQAGEVVEKDCLEVLDCDECKKECALFDDNIDKPIHGKECVIHVDGRYITLLKNIEILREPEGMVVGGLESFIDITGQKQAAKEREKLIKKLQDALGEVKTLSGLLPICASCKRIRDDNGYWKQIETYIKEHSEADFSHSLCPECVKKLYPNLRVGQDDLVKK